MKTLLDDRFAADPHSTTAAEEVEKLESQTSEELRLFSRSIIALDPPDQTRLRRLLQPSFTGRGMKALQGSIQQVVDDFLDDAERDAAERGESAPDRRMYLIEAFAHPFPITVIGDMLGIPREDRETIRGWTGNLLRVERMRGAEVNEETRAEIREFTDYLKDLLKQKRRVPADDMISRLVHVEDDGEVLDEEEMLATVFLMFLAGHVTTVNMVGNGVVALLRHPTSWSSSRRIPSCWPRVKSKRRCATGDPSTSSAGAPPGRTSKWAGRSSRRERRRRSIWPRQTGILSGSRTRTPSTSPARMPTGTPRSARESMSAWEHLQRVSKDKSPSPPCFDGFRSCGWRLRPRICAGDSFPARVRKPAGPLLGPAAAIRSATPADRAVTRARGTSQGAAGSAP